MKDGVVVDSMEDGVKANALCLVCRQHTLLEFISNGSFRSVIMLVMKRVCIARPWGVCTSVEIRR